MFKKHLLAAALLGGVVLVAGCTSHVTKPEQYSGFLDDYSGLAEGKSASGKPTMIWKKPGFKMSDYGRIVFQPAAFFPAPLPDERVDLATLNKILDYANAQIGPALRYRVSEAQTPGPRVMDFHGAVTGVGAANQGLKPYEVIPIGLVIASTQSASGHRTQNTELFLEAQATDATTGQPLLKVVRKVMGKTVSNEKKPVTLDDLKGAIDELAKDIREYKD